MHDLGIKTHPLCNRSPFRSSRPLRRRAAPSFAPLCLTFPSGVCGAGCMEEKLKIRISLPCSSCLSYSGLRSPGRFLEVCAEHRGPVFSFSLSHLASMTSPIEQLHGNHDIDTFLPPLPQNPTAHRLDSAFTTAIQFIELFNAHPPRPLISLFLASLERQQAS